MGFWLGQPPGGPGGEGLPLCWFLGGLWLSALRGRTGLGLGEEEMSTKGIAFTARRGMERMRRCWSCILDCGLLSF